MSKVTLGGSPIEIDGRFLQVGDAAPAFRLTGADLAEVGLDAFAGKRKVLNIVPSLDTPVCATSTRKFNADAGSLSDTVVLVVSADLPFAAKRFCEPFGQKPVKRGLPYRKPEQVSYIPSAYHLFEHRGAGRVRHIVEHAVKQASADGVEFRRLYVYEHAFFFGVVYLLNVI